MWEIVGWEENSHLVPIPTAGNGFGPISQPAVGWDGFRNGNCGLGVTLYWGIRGDVSKIHGVRIREELGLEKANTQK